MPPSPFEYLVSIFYNSEPSELGSRYQKQEIGRTLFLEARYFDLYFICLFWTGWVLFLLWLLYIVFGRKSKISLRSHEQKNYYESCFPLEQDVLVPPRWHKRQTMDLELPKCSKNSRANARFISSRVTKNQITKQPTLVFNECIGVLLEKRRGSMKVLKWRNA